LQEKLLKAYKELLALEEEKEREAALVELERPQGRRWKRLHC